MMQSVCKGDQLAALRAEQRVLVNRNELAAAAELEPQIQKLARQVRAEANAERKGSLPLFRPAETVESLRRNRAEYLEAVARREGAHGAE